MQGTASKYRDFPFPREEVRLLLDKSFQEFNHPGFIADDPISIPHRYSTKENIEISGFLVATIAWGNRKTIINNALKLVQWMDDDPYGFITGFREKDLKPFENFVHRTFNGDDCLFFLNALQYIYKNYGGLENVFIGHTPGNEVMDAIVNFRKVFFEIPHLHRSQKHVANPQKNAIAKRINMFLRWMVRKDDKGVDFGIWRTLKPSMLMCPLDVHTGNVSRQLKLLSRKQNDWKAVEELTQNLRFLDPGDPVKYDIALFGLGVNSKI